MARRRKGRAINGILLLDKPLGGSSNHALQQVKRMFFAAKAGHTGALDPLATGMLPICLGEATKFSQFLLDSDKTYEVTAKLGVRTTTSDADGEVVETKPVSVSQQQLDDAIESFKGPIKQVPSMFSALKHQGKPLYFYARQGIEIERQARDITIFSLQITRFASDEVDMTVHCSKGTYIRSLVDDLGQMLGCGAFVSKLHRTQVADYPADRSVNMAQLNALVEQANASDEACYHELDKLLLPMDTAVHSLPIANIDDNAAKLYLNGQAVSGECNSKDGLVRVYAGEDALFLGVAEITSEGVLAPKRVVVYNH